MPINVSIVIYKHSVAEIQPLVDVLRESRYVLEIFLVDNSPLKQEEFVDLGVTYIFNNKNIGYGAAHNIAIRRTLEQNIPYHLVLNPDIIFQSEILAKIDEFMNNNSNIGLLMPKVYYPNGEIQYLCKLLPTPFDLIFRRFLPKAWTKKRADVFELRASEYNRIMDVPYLSGCFMFLRTESVRKVGLFDERFFMYPEDIDLTRRIHQKYRTVFYPEVSVVHQHAQGSYAVGKLLFIHMKNMIKYFNKWGWFFDAERRIINNETLKQLK
jgi:GT2 family glycosyltransferase